MKRFFYVLFAFGIICSIAYSARSVPDKVAEIVTRPDGTQYMQCINPGSNCAV